MNKYFGVFSFGFEKQVFELLENNDCVVDKILKDSVLFSSENELEVVQNFLFFKSIFFVIQDFEEKYSLNEQYSWIKNNVHKLRRALPAQFAGKSFRMIPSKSNINHSEFRDFNNSVSGLLEKNNFNISRGKSDFEISLNEKEGFGFIGVKLKPSHRFVGLKNRGGIDLDVAFLLNYLSNPESSDVFIDPFCGFGVIPLMRTNWEYKQVYACDNDISSMMETLSNVHEFYSSFSVLKQSALNLKSIQHNTISKIVTDPPWGEMNIVSGIESFYFSFFKEVMRVLVDGGKIIVLSSQKEVMEKILEKYKDELVLEFVQEVRIAGKESFVWKIWKN